MNKWVGALFCALAVFANGCGKGGDAAGGSPVGNWSWEDKREEVSTAGVQPDGSEEGGPGAFMVVYYKKSIKIEANQITFVSECSVPELSLSTKTESGSAITIDGKGITLATKSLAKSGGFPAKNKYVQCNVSVNAYGPLPYTRVDDTHLKVTLTGGSQTLTLIP